MINVTVSPEKNKQKKNKKKKHKYTAHNVPV